MKAKKISAEIVADSISPQGHRITTFLLTYPRFIHAEVMTHRLFSRNTASSRAIPFNKMVKSIEEDPFIPIVWQKDHKGMQGSEYWTEKDILIPYSDESYEIEAVRHMYNEWLAGRDYAIACASELNKHGLTKQLCNRMLEPYMWHTALVTATEWENFLDLRCPRYKTSGLATPTVRSRKEWIEIMNFSSVSTQCPQTEEEWWSLSESGAEIHIQALAEAIYDSLKENIPEELKEGEWHIPFNKRIEFEELDINSAIKVAVARCARLSYMTFDGKIDPEKDIKLHDDLLESKHFSPFEHCARVMSLEEIMSFIKGEMDTIEIDEVGPNSIVASNEIWNDSKENAWCNNFRGFIQYRYLIEHP